MLAWIAEHTPGPRIAVSVEGTRSYGVGLARALVAAGLLVLECEQPNRRQRRGRGKSDPIDAHLAVLSALRLDSERLPAMRADGDREALRILLGSREEVIATSTAQTNRLRALLLTGEDADRCAARRALTATALLALTRRHLPREASRQHAIRHAEIRRLALAIREANRQLADNSKQMRAVVGDLPPGSWIITASAQSPQPRPSSVSPTPADAETTPPLPPSPAPAHYQPAAAKSCGTDSTVAATEP